MFWQNMVLNPNSGLKLTAQISKDNSSAQQLSMHFNSSSFKTCKRWPLSPMENSGVFNSMHMEKVLSNSEVWDIKSQMEYQNLGCLYMRKIKSTQNPGQERQKC